jgi:hypothetical protein
MASPLVWKIYSRMGLYVAACRYAEDAAAVVAFHGEGTRVMRGGFVVYTEDDNVLAASNADGAAAIMHEMYAVKARARSEKLRMRSESR